jgi:sterol 3beta-glucosyltransferase
MSRKLRRKRLERESVAMQNLPEDLQDSDDQPASSEPNPSAPPMVMNMNQSIFGLIAAAGSRVNFEEHLDGSSSDENNQDAEADDEVSSSETEMHQQQDLSQTVILDPKASKGKAIGRRREKISGARLLKSFHSLPSRKPRSKMQPSKLSQKTSDPEEDSRPASEPITPPDALAIAEEEARPVPVMSQMLAARAEVAERGSLDIDRLSSDAGQGNDAGQEDDSTPLARRLMQIFEFDEPEQVIEGWFCSAF